MQTISRLLLMVLLGQAAQFVSADSAAPQDRLSCEGLALVAVPDTRLSGATLVTDRADLPAFCQLEGRIEERIGFVMRLPADSWNGKFAVAGCGGFCGALKPEKPGYSNSINESLKLGYAVIQTDGGHEAESWDTDWAIADPRALELYAGAWMPLAVATGKIVVEHYYNRAPRRTYFSGCSNGGRLGMYAAQRYPDLFDGIAAGGGIFDLTGNAGIHGMWKAQAIRDRQGRALVDRTKLPMLAAAVTSQCDELDGVADGVVARPSLCKPDLASLQCEEGAQDGCFTTTELTAIQYLYQGATVAGRQVFVGVPPGSESLWATWLIGDEKERAWGERATEGNLRLTYGLPSDRPFNVHDYDLARELDELQRLAPVLNATDPDLSAFAASGGKLFYYHGLADPLILEGRVRQYYSEASALLGEEKLASVARFFMVPGHGHCWEKPGQVADDFNPVEIIDRWVDGGRAPDYVVAERLEQDEAGTSQSRKLCPYPKVAVFRGGDTDLADNFSCQ